MRQQAGLVQGLTTDYVLLDKEGVSHRAHHSAIKMNKKEVALLKRFFFFVLHVQLLTFLTTR